jgi:iron complex transport system ATP-binding protein
MADGQVTVFGTPDEVIRDEVLTGIFGTPVKVLETDDGPLASYF